MDAQHELALDSVLRGAKSLCILDHGNTVFVIDKIGVVGTLLFQEVAGQVALRGDEHILHLFTEIGDKAGALHQLQFVGPSMLLAGVVATGLDGAVFAALLW